MNVATALKAVGFSLRLIIFLVTAVVLVYVAVAVCFWCKATDLEKGLVIFSSAGAIVTVWVTIVMRPRS